MNFDRVIKSGTLVLEGETIEADLAIQEGKIVEIGRSLKGKETIPADGCLVIPGGIDPHVHLEMPTSLTVSSDDWNTGTRAAAFGGTTTVIDFIEPEPGQTLLDAAILRRQQAERGAWIDYGLHMTIANTDPDTLFQIPAVIQAGLPSFKIYTTYDFKLVDTELIQVMNSIGQAGGILLTHAENDAIVQFMRSKLILEGKVDPCYHPISRPAQAEAEAIERVLSIAATTKTLVYIVHVSTRSGALAIERAHLRNQRLFGETCPQYLLLTDDEYSRPGFEGAKFVCSPPLRKKEDNEFLWHALSKGILNTIGTDHCPFYYAGQKDLGKDSFINIPGGMPGIEARVMLAYTYGVIPGLIDLNQWVQLTSTNAARIFGLYPNKGTIQPGSDADLVIFDPNRTGTLSVDMLHENVDYTPYEGFPYHGQSMTTILRGDVIVQNGKWMAKEPKGRFLERSTPVI